MRGLFDAQARTTLGARSLVNSQPGKELDMAKTTRKRTQKTMGETSGAYALPTGTRVGSGTVGPAQLNLPASVWSKEPVLVLAMVQSGIALVTSFGMSLTAEQIGAILAFTSAVLGVVARSQVTPTK
jgi:hypothetical protein